MSVWGRELRSLLADYPLPITELARKFQLDQSTVHRWIAQGPPARAKPIADAILAEIPTMAQEIANWAVNKPKLQADPSPQGRLDAFVQALKLLADACTQAAALVEPTPPPSADELLARRVEPVEDAAKRKRG